MPKRISMPFAAIFLVLTLGIMLSGCGGQKPPPASPTNTPALPTASPTAVQQPPTATATERPAGALKGVALSPQGFPLDYSKFPEFLSEVGGWSNGAITWNGAWREDVAGEIPESALSVVENASAYGYTPVVVFGWRSDTRLHLSVPGDVTNDWTNSEARRLFEQMLIDFASEYRPRFVFVGNENDFYYEQNPGDYARWIDFYERAYDAIKEASPDTLVGPVFNYEHLAGLGALAGWESAHWGALEAHDLAKVDVLGLTIYPWFNHAAPDQIPSDYLGALFSRIGDTPIAITETGWPAEDQGGLDPMWETSEAAQVTYLQQLSRLLRGENVELVNWLFLYPMVDPGGRPQNWQLFSSLSLRDNSGDKRPVYDTWLDFSP